MAEPLAESPQAVATVRLDLADEAATRSLAARLAAVARRGDIFALSGGLGAGKTVFARAFVRALGRADEDVPSPTFTLVQTYDVPAGTVWHVDLYRLSSPEEAWELGIEEAFAEGIALIEWPERLGYLLPADRLDILLESAAGPDARRVTLTGRGRMAARAREAGLA